MEQRLNCKTVDFMTLLSQSLPPHLQTNRREFMVGLETKMRKAQAEDTKVDR